MTTTENEYIKGEATHVGICLLNMTTIGNVISVNFFGFQGSYLLNMTTIVNYFSCQQGGNSGIYLFEMTTIGNGQFNLFGASLRYLPV